MYEEVYAEHYDTAGNYHWTGTESGTHIYRFDDVGKVVPNDRVTTIIYSTL